MSLLFRLVSDIIKDILCEWIDVFDLGCLDIAVCCSKRPEFLALLQQMPGMSTISQSFNGNIPVNAWAVSRGLKVVKIELNEFMFSEEGVFLLPLNLGVLKHLSIKLVYPEVTVDLPGLLTACRSLKSIELDDFVAWDLVDKQVFTNLEAVMVYCRHSNAAVCLGHLETSCRNLKSLTLHVHSHTYGLPSLLLLNPRLTELNVDGRKSDLAMILKNCPSIQRVSLHINDDFSVAPVREFLLAKPNVRFLRFSSVLHSITYDNGVGNRSVELKFGNEAVDKDELASLLSLMKSLHSLSCTFKPDFPVDLLLDCVALGPSLTKLTVRNSSALFMERILPLLPNVIDLNWYTLELLCPNVLPYFHKLRYLSWNLWRNLDQVIELLAACHNLVEGELYIKLTDDESENWLTRIQSLIGHIARLDFTILSGLNSIHGKYRVEYGTLIEK